MTEAKLTWSIWQALLNAFAWAFTRHGFHRFAEGITAMAINVEEHTITQSVLAVEQPAAWKALESFAEYGAWHEDRVTWALTRLIATAPGRIWHGYHVSAVDDTKVHRSSPPRLGDLYLPRVRPVAALVGRTPLHTRRSSSNLVELKGDSHQIWELKGDSHQIWRTQRGQAATQGVARHCFSE